jgi:hypothetical protein
MRYRRSGGRVKLRLKKVAESDADFSGQIASNAYTRAIKIAIR